MSNEQKLRKALEEIKFLHDHHVIHLDGCSFANDMGHIALNVLASTEPEQPAVWELALCESHFLCLKPDVLYRFTVREGCDECANAAGEASIFPPEINQVHCEHPASEEE